MSVVITLTTKMGSTIHAEASSGLAVSWKLRRFGPQGNLLNELPPTSSSFNPAINLYVADWNAVEEANSYRVVATTEMKTDDQGVPFGPVVV
ncbi:MAG: hypothetical protein L0215_12985 [Gemmataceae bacterium]|nr:hypothetical protein [Gemmataceae bacterium]